MTDLIKRFPIDADINNPAPMLPSALGHDFVKGEADAHMVVITVTNGGEAVSFAGGSAAVYVVREGDGGTVNNPASTDGNVVSATLKAECFAIPGRILIIARATVGGATKVLSYKYATVRNGITDVVVDPGNALPSLEETMAYIAANSVQGNYSDLTAYERYNKALWLKADGGDGCNYMWNHDTPSVPGTDPGESANWIKVAEGGEDGEAIVILGTYADLTALRAVVPSPSIGDLYNVGASAPYNVYRATGLANPNDWEDQGTLQGSSNMDDMTQGSTKKYVSAAELAVLQATSGANTGDQDLTVKADIETAAALTSGGLESGGAVTAQGTPDQTVAVAEHYIITPEGKRIHVDATAALAADAADGTNPRIDIVYDTAAGVTTYLAGTAAASPAQPATPANGTLLCAINRAATVNPIATGDIEDQRRFVSKTDDGEDIVPVTESGNTFALDLGFRKKNAFSFTIDNTTGKTITVSNRPYGDCDVSVQVKFTATAAVTHTLDGESLSWVGGVAPSFVTGYTYELLYSYFAALDKWVGRFNQGVAN